jgi:succinoglycan biosynthesis protein ExoV
MENHNFGDELNLHLWKSLLPELESTHHNHAILGVGTLQGLALPSAQHINYIHVLGSGGNGTPPENWLDSRFKTHFVRGPLTAKKWNQSGKEISDGAYLIRISEILNSIPSTPDKLKQIGYIPHHYSDSHSDIAYICSLAGLKYISPCQKNIYNFITEVSSCSSVITEALHGAIIADALRIPWISVKSGEQVFDFKWRDWELSIGIESNPPGILDFCLSKGISKGRRIENSIKRTLISAGIGKKKWRNDRVFYDSQTKLDVIGEQLLLIKNSANYQLSKESTIKAIDQKLYDVMVGFTKDFGLNLKSK